MNVKIVNIWERCERECKPDDIDDLGANGHCVAYHNSYEEHEEHGFCAYTAFFAHGCEICQHIAAEKRFPTPEEYKQLIEEIKEEEERESAFYSTHRVPF